MTEYEYDALGRQTAVIAPDPGTGVRSRVETVYGDEGRVAKGAGKGVRLISTERSRFPARCGPL